MVIFGMPADCHALTHTGRHLWAGNIGSYAAVCTLILLSETKLTQQMLPFRMKFLIAEVFSMA